MNLLTSTSPIVIVENAPLNFVKPGYYERSDGYFYRGGADGYYWSTTVDSSTNAHGFGFYSDSFTPHYSNFKGYGFSVR